MLKGMVLGRLPAPLNTVLAETRAFLGEIDNWSVCDSFCAGYLHAKRHPGEIFAFAKLTFPTGVNLPRALALCF